MQDLEWMLRADRDNTMATILYSLAGEGRGHATRVRTIVEMLRAEHRFVIFAPGGAFAMLAPLYAGSGVRVVQIAGLQFAYTPSRAAINITPRVRFVARPPGEMDVTYADITCAQSRWSWRPCVDLVDGLADFVRWLDYERRTVPDRLRRLVARNRLPPRIRGSITRAGRGTQPGRSIAGAPVLSASRWTEEAMPPRSRRAEVRPERRPLVLDTPRRLRLRIGNMVVFNDEVVRRVVYDRLGPARDCELDTSRAANNVLYPS